MSSPVEKGNLIATVVVGVIVAGLQIGGTLYMVRKQEEVKAELSQRIGESSKLGQAVADKKLEFHNQAISLIGKIDMAFHEIVYLIPYKDAEKRLTDALANYRDLLAQPIAGFESNVGKAEEIKKSMRDYSKFVIDKWNVIKTEGSKVSDQQKNVYYKESEELKNQAINQVGKLLLSGAA